MNPLLNRPLYDIAGVCSRDDIVCVIAEDPLPGVLRLMAQRCIGAVIVIDAQGRTEGIFTERDLIMKIDDIATIGSKTTVGDLMTRGVVSIQATTTFAEAADLMLDCGFRHLIISDRNGFPDGIVSIRDLFRVLRRAADGETGP
jgi:CBS domain-containing protein